MKRSRRRANSASSTGGVGRVHRAPRRSPSRGTEQALRCRRWPGRGLGRFGRSPRPSHGAARSWLRIEVMVAAACARPPGSRSHATGVRRSFGRRANRVHRRSAREDHEALRNEPRSAGVGRRRWLSLSTPATSAEGELVAIRGREATRLLSIFATDLSVPATGSHLPTDSVGASGRSRRNATDRASSGGARDWNSSRRTRRSTSTTPTSPQTSATTPDPPPQSKSLRTASPGTICKASPN